MDVGSGSGASGPMQHIVTCPECTGLDPELIEDTSSGDLICRRHGIVLSERIIDTTAEYRTFADDGGKTAVDPTRAGAAVNPHLAGGGISTLLGSGGGVSGDSAALKWSNRGGMDKDDKVMAGAFRKIKDLAKALDLEEKFVEKAREIFAQYYKAKGFAFVRARGVEPLAAACVYSGCRMAGAPRMFKEICAVTQVDERQIKNAFRAVRDAVKSNINAVTSSDYMGRFCANLGLPISVSNAAIHVSKVAAEKCHVGSHEPASLAAASILFVVNQRELCSQSVDIKQISSVAGVSVSTVNQLRRVLKEYEAVLMPPKTQSMGSK